MHHDVALRQLPGQPLSGIGTLGVLVVVAGLGITPFFVVAYLLIDDAVDESREAEANSWVGTSNNFGSALGAMLAGLAGASVLGRGVLAAGFALALTVSFVVVARGGTRSPRVSVGP